MVRSIILFIFLQVVAHVLCPAQTAGFAKSSGTDIYYRTFGSGVPVLIINGGPGLNSDGFADLAKKLSANNQTIIYDQRGTGKSYLKNIDRSTLTMDLMVADMESIRKKLNISRWIILGHSFGGMLASYYATIYPENIISLVLSSSGGIDLGLMKFVQTRINANLTKTQQDSIGYWAQKISKGDTSYFAKLQRAKALANAYVFDKKNVPLIAERLVVVNFQVNNLIFEDMQSIKFDCAGKLSHFDKPVLIIQGKQDIIDKGTADKEHRVLKNSTVVLLDHCIHYGWLDDEKKYLGTVRNFILKTSMVSR